MKLTNFYGTGEGLPEMHPDPSINHELLMQALCTKLDTARQAMARALEMNVVTPAAIAMKDHLRWASCIRIAAEAAREE